MMMDFPCCTGTLSTVSGKVQVTAGTRKNKEEEEEEKKHFIT